ncbi:MAG: hypothetical protein K6A40_01205 [Solobacterium sp.]|nr:hypothetical protein [Solobacterium sp.]
MKQVMHICCAFILVLLLSSCSSSKLPSINSVIVRGEEKTESIVSKYTMEEIIAEWGEPEDYPEYERTGKYLWITPNGSVTLSFPDGHAHIESTNHIGAGDYPWPLSLIPYGSRWRVLVAFLVVVIPPILIFTVVSFLLKLTGITGGDDTYDSGRSGKGWFFSKPDGSKPWDGI